MSISHATNDTFSELTQEGLVLVDFWAPWCGPCKMISPVLEEIDVLSKDEVKIVKVNVDDEGETAREMGVMSIPSLFLFKDGKMVDKMVGFAPREAIQSFIDQHK